MKTYAVYMMTNTHNTVLYIGVTNNLARRIVEHKHGTIPGFTKKYNVHKLVYFEEGNDITAAIHREKTLKGWTRVKKNALVQSVNPDWRDLSLPSGDSSLRSE